MKRAHQHATLVNSSWAGCAWTGNQLFNASARKQVGLSAGCTHAPNGKVIYGCINHGRQSSLSRLLSTCFWQSWHTGGHYHRNSLINCCGWGVVTSAVVNYCRTQRSNGRFRTTPRFTESRRRGMMGIVCLDARLSGRDVMPGYRRSPYCPSVRVFMPPALCIPNEGGPTLASGNVLQYFSLRGWFRCDIMAENVNQTQPEATSIQTIDKPRPIAPLIGQTRVSSHCERSVVIIHSNVNVAGMYYVLLG